MKNIFALLVLTALSGVGCHAAYPTTAFDSTKTPAPPDYSKLANWAAHPAKKDSADRTPCPDMKDAQATAEVDVFFAYPTSYTGDRPDRNHWNAAVDDSLLNLKTDGGSILFQASIFNGAGRVFAPRYRQAHLYTFFAKDKQSAAQALDLAYTDVKAAFEYYIKYENKGRPFILAGHSQGARHIMMLLRDEIENTPLEKKLVVAYIAGWPVNSQFFKKLKPCESSNQTDCYCTWRTWERKYGLRPQGVVETRFGDNRFAVRDNIVCTNPLTWHITNREYAPKTLNKGGVIRPFCAVYPGLTDAEVFNGILLCRRPHFPGSILIRGHNYHPGDFNLYYMNVRENAQERVRAYWKR